MKFDLPEFAGKDVVFVGIGQGRSMAGVEELLVGTGTSKASEASTVSVVSPKRTVSCEITTRPRRYS